MVKLSRVPTPLPVGACAWTVVSSSPASGAPTQPPSISADRPERTHRPRILRIVSPPQGYVHAPKGSKMSTLKNSPDFNPDSRLWEEKKLLRKALLCEATLKNSIPA